LTETLTYFSAGMFSSDVLNSSFSTSFILECYATIAAYAILDFSS